MSEPASNDDYFDAPLTLTDYIEIVADDLDEAVHNLEPHEIEHLLDATRKKVDALLRENRRRAPTSAPDRDPNDWWDR